MVIEKVKFGNFVEYVKKAFTEVTQEVVESEYAPIAVQAIEEDKKVAIVIGISGNTKGRILLQCSFETAMNFSIAMNCGDELDDPKDMYMYMAEFSNMYCGRATTYANNEYREREFWLTTPAIFSAKDLEISTPSVESEIAYYRGDQGIFSIDIGFEG
jgi:chemotaxis protein CheX